MLCQLPLTPLNEAWAENKKNKIQSKSKVNPKNETQSINYTFNNTIQNYMKNMSEDQKHSYIESLILNDINNQQKVINIESFSNLDNNFKMFLENKDFKMFLLFLIAFLIVKCLHD